MRQLNIKVFKLDEEWLSFVMANRTRTFPDRYKQYDVIVGAIADEKSTLSDANSSVQVSSKPVLAHLLTYQIISEPISYSV